MGVSIKVLLLWLKRHSTWFLVFFGLLAIVLPIAFYLYRFGFGLWESHEDWAMMGDFFAGVLGPIITAFSLIFLALQVKEQTRQRREAEVFRRCHESVIDIKMYIDRAKEKLPGGDEANAKKTAREVIRIEEGLSDQDLPEVIGEFVAKNLSLFNSWSMVDQELRFLMEQDFKQYKRMQRYVISHIDAPDLVDLEKIRINSASGEKDSVIYKGIS